MNGYSVAEDIFTGFLIGVSAFVAYQLAVNIFQLGYELGVESVAKRDNIVTFKKAEASNHD